VLINVPKLRVACSNSEFTLYAKSRLLRDKLIKHCWRWLGYLGDSRDSGLVRAWGLTILAVSPWGPYSLFPFIILQLYNFKWGETSQQRHPTRCGIGSAVVPCWAFFKSPRYPIQSLANLTSLTTSDLGRMLEMMMAGSIPLSFYNHLHWEAGDWCFAHLGSRLSLFREGGFLDVIKGLANYGYEGKNRGMSPCCDILITPTKRRARSVLLHYEEENKTNHL
jgi:hypothetical protein